MKVCILFNEPLTDAVGGCTESDAGVLEQLAAVGKALNELGIPFRSYGIHTAREAVRILMEIENEIVFNLVETIDGSVEKSATVPLLCESLNLAWTGTAGSGLLLSSDKWKSKAVLTVAGLPCPQAISLAPGTYRDPEFSGPYIVKPAATDAGEGIDDKSIVRDPGDSLHQAVGRVHETFGQAALIEQYIEGRELNVSILWGPDGATVMPLAEIDFQAYSEGKPRIVGYDAKWKADSFEYNNTPRVIPAPLPERVAEEVRDLTQKACAVLGCNGVCRVDFRLDHQLQPYILEINANPDISPDAGFAAAVEAAGISYRDFVKTCLDFAMHRSHIYIKE